MEPLTHLLTGACLSRAGLNQKTALATTMLVIAAELPDVDIFYNLAGPVTGFAHHRGFTHSLLGAPVDAVLALGLVYGIFRLRAALGRPPARPPRWGVLFLYGWLSALVHLLLDFTTSYGVRPFIPFSYRWFSWDIVYIVEPVILVLLLMGLVVPGLFSLIQEEIGARRKATRGRGGAIFALAAMVLLWGVRDYQHRRAIAALDSRIYHDAEPLRVGAFPYPVDPFRWHGVVETDAFYETMRVNSAVPDVEADGRTRLRYKPAESPALDAARNSSLGRVYLDWARFPVLEVEPLDPRQGGYLVRFLDLRFIYNENDARPLAAAVELDGNLGVVEERFGRRVQRR
ncbi:MAG: metal-dependent hydrolase [Terriglobales bacterium]